MRVLIVSDMEGVAGICRWEQVVAEGVETREAIAVFCGIGLIVSLLLATSRLDLSAGFF